MRSGVLGATCLRVVLLLALLAMPLLIKAQTSSTPSWHPHAVRHPAVTDAGEEDGGEALDLGAENEEELEEEPLTAAEEEEADAALEAQGADEEEDALLADDEHEAALTAEEEEGELAAFEGSPEDEEALDDVEEALEGAEELLEEGAEDGEEMLEGTEDVLDAEAEAEAEAAELEAAAEEALAEEEAIESAEDDLVEDLEEADALQGVDEEELGEAAEEEELLGEESVVEEQEVVEEEAAYRRALLQDVMQATAEDTGEEPVSETVYESEAKAATDEKLREEEDDNNLPHGTPSWHPSRAAHHAEAAGRDEDEGDVAGEGELVQELEPEDESFAASAQENAEAAADSAAEAAQKAEVAADAAMDAADRAHAEVAAELAAEAALEAEAAAEEAAAMADTSSAAEDAADDAAALAEAAADSAADAAELVLSFGPERKMHHRRLLMSADCPQDRFLLLGPRSYTGGFNNMLLTLENAFLAARLTNRTLVVPPSRNERYNWLRIDAALDQEQLRHFWPCFIGSDEVWGTLPAPVATATATARKLLGGVIASHKGLAPSDYNPADGTYAAMVPLNGVNSQAQPTTGLRTADLVGATHMGRPDARDYPVLRVGGNAWGGLMTMCPDHTLSAEFWAHVKPSQPVQDEVDAFIAEKLSGNGGRYVAVHLRWLEGKCVGRAQGYYVKEAAGPIGAMCSNSYKLTNKIMRAKGLDPATTPLFVASDRQRQDADKDFAANGAISYDRGNTKDKYYGDGTHFVRGRAGVMVFEPAVDMFLLEQAHLFVGNMLSTFSTNVAAIRYAAGERESVLSWPQIETDKSFWQCERAHFWCGPPTSEWSSAGKTKAHGTC